MRRARLLSLTAAIVLLGRYPVPSAHAKDARQIASETFPSVVLLVMNDARGQPVSLGSGFFVAKDIVATNMHVIQNAASGYAKLVGQEAKYAVAGTVAADYRCDLVLLQLHDANAPALSLADSRQVQVGDEVYAVGNPQGLEGTFSRGIVSGIRKLDDDTLLQITAPISPGSSGGPVLDAGGTVIGVSVATFSEGQNLNFAVPASYLRLLVTGPRSLRPLTSRAGPPTRTPSMLSSFGNRNSEGVVCTSLRWRSPHYQLGDYSFSVQNRLQNAVSSVICLVVFFDKAKQPIDIDLVISSQRDVIPAGLAKRMTSRVDDSVQKLTTKEGSSTPHTRIEFRVLDFQILESGHLF